MTAERAERVVSADEDRLDEEELRRQQLSDPEVRERVRQIMEESDPDEGSGVTAEELPDFLRDQHR